MSFKLDKFTISIIALVVIVGVVGIILYNNRSTRTSNFSNQPVYDNGRIVLNGSQGDVSIANIYARPVRRLEKNDIIVLVNDQYEVLYSPTTQGFVVTILVSNYTTAVEAAQTALLKTLDVAAEQACTLNIVVNVPYSVNPDLSGREYLLPACD